MMEKIGESPLLMNPLIQDTAIKMGFGGVKRQVGLARSFLPPFQGLRVVGGRHLGFRLRLYPRLYSCRRFAAVPTRNRPAGGGGFAQ